MGEEQNMNERDKNQIARKIILKHQTRRVLDFIIEYKKKKSLIYDIEIVHSKKYRTCRATFKNVEKLGNL